MLTSNARISAGRFRRSLDGRWRFARDPGDVGLAEGWHEHGLPGPSDTLEVPGIWNRVYPRYEGIAWYETRFTADSPDGAAWLQVGAANQLAQFWLNGELLGEHEGGYVPFELSCDRARVRGGANRLVARVVDPPMQGEVGGLRLWETACAKEAWYYRYGGIWGSVALEWRGPLWLEDAFLHASPDLRVAHAVVEIGARDESGARLRIELRDPNGVLLGAAEQAIQVQAGCTRIEMGLPVGDPLAWQPDRPAQYEARLTLSWGDRRETAEVLFGLRYSELRDGVFLLNGREIVLKGALVQPNYPLELVRPPSPDLLDREIQALHDGGFNLARVHLRPPAPGFLERADRAGLLVYVETALAWIKPHERLLERGQREVRETLRLLRNHPSVAIWGCFNENRQSAALVGRELLALGHGLDATRPIADDSGGTAVDEGGGWHGQSHSWSDDDPFPTPFNDLHIYLASPLRRSAARYLRQLGRTDRFSLSVEGQRRVGGKRSHDLAPGSIFVSEYGYGGIPDVERVAARFGEELETVDGRDAAGYRDSLRQGVTSRGLGEQFGGTSGLIREAQALHARGDVRQTEELRLNPRVSGYVLTQLNDAAWELSAGLVDVWREPKAALWAMQRANAARVLVLRAERDAVFEGSTVPLRSWLVDEQPSPGVARLHMELRAPNGTVEWSADRDVRIGQSIQPLGSVHATAPLVEGQHRLTAWLELGNERVETSEPLLVLEQPVADEGHGLAVLGPHLRRLLPASEAWSGSGAALLAEAGALRAAQLFQVAGWVRGGGRLCLLDVDRASAPRIGRAFGLDLSVQGSRGSFLGYFHFLRPHSLFVGLPHGVAHEPFADVLPEWSLRELAGAQGAAGVITVGAASQWAWFADVQTVPIGSGSLTLYQYRPHRAPRGDVVALRLLTNLASFVRASGSGAHDC